jgi:molybdate transport system regulatory protein
MGLRNQGVDMAEQGALRARSKVWIERDGDVVLSEWRIELLEAVAETGSLAKAAERIGVPYRTAWDRIRQLERRLGIELLATESGGSDGGGSTLTPAALDIVQRFRRVTTGIAQLVDERFHQEFGHLA